MTYPQELHENTRLSDANYPMNIFRNRAESVQIGEMILFLHWHEHFELILMTRGQAIFHIDGQAYEAAEGDLLIVPSGGLHTGYSRADQQTVEYVSIVFNQVLLRNPFHSDPAYAKWMEPFLNGNWLAPVKLAAEEERSRTIRAIAEQAVQEFERKEPGFELIVRHQLSILIALLSRSYMPSGREGALQTTALRHNEQFKRLLRYLDSHYGESIALEQAAKQLNVNPYHFCKIFKRATGSTFVEYMNHLRVRAAERLLAETDYSMTEIAERIGCGNANYFTRLFKRYREVTPSDYRKAALKSLQPVESTIERPPIPQK